MQKLEDQIFPTIIEDDNNYNATTLSDTIYASRTNKKNDINNNINRKANRNESLDKYQSPIQIFVALRLPGIIYN
jgi:hypothetical protein